MFTTDSLGGYYIYTQISSTPLQFFHVQLGNCRNTPWGTSTASWDSLGITALDQCCLNHWAKKKGIKSEWCVYEKQPTNSAYYAFKYILIQRQNNNKLLFFFFLKNNKWIPNISKSAQLLEETKINLICVKNVYFVQIIIYNCYNYPNTRAGGGRKFELLYILNKNRSKGFKYNIHHSFTPIIEQEHKWKDVVSRFNTRSSYRINT